MEGLPLVIREPFGALNGVFSQPSGGFTPDSIHRVLKMPNSIVDNTIISSRYKVQLDGVSVTFPFLTSNLSILRH